MASKPRCARCGRVLTDAVSIAAGMGPECRGDSSGKGVTLKSKTRHASKAPYIAMGQSAQIGGVVIAHTADGWTVNGNTGPLAEAWLRRYMPGVMVESESVSLPTMLQDYLPNLEICK